MRKFHWLERLEHDGQGLIAYLVELLPGAPDGSIGLPLVVRPDSQRLRVQFASVGAFKSVPEMYNELSDPAVEIEPFLFQEPSSGYMHEMSQAMEMACGISGGTLKHFVIYAENSVTHVLTAEAPAVLAGHGP